MPIHDVLIHMRTYHDVLLLVFEQTWQQRSVLEVEGQQVVHQEGNKSCRCSSQGYSMDPTMKVLQPIPIPAVVQAGMRP